MTDYDYLYDPEHKKAPKGSGWRKTEKGWSKSDYEKDIQKPYVKDKYVFEHNAIFRFESNMKVNFHGTTKESKSFPNKFKEVLKRFKNKKENEYQKFQDKYSEILDIVIEKSKEKGNELIVYGWSVRNGKTESQFEVEMLGVDPIHTSMIGEEIAKEFGRVEIATDTPTSSQKSIIIDKNGNASKYYGLPPVEGNKTRFTFSSNVTIDIDNSEPKTFMDNVKKKLKNNIIGLRNDIETKKNKLMFFKKIKKAFEKAGIEYKPQQMSITPVYGGYRDQKTQKVKTEISYDIHFKQIEPNTAVFICQSLNDVFNQQSTLLTGYGNNKRAAFYVNSEKETSPFVQKLNKILK